MSRKAAKEDHPAEPTPDRPDPLRLWPAVVIVVLTLAAVLVPSFVAPATSIQLFGMLLGPLVGALAMGAWWLLASRAPRIERIVGVVLFVVAAVVTWFLTHAAASMGFLVYGIPLALTATTIWLLVAQRWSLSTRRIGGGLVVLASLGCWTLLRSDGVYGSIAPQFAWRWSATAEERYLAVLADRGIGSADEINPESVSIAPELQSEDWPGFRGPARDSRVSGVTLSTDWATHPPREIWRRPIGPAWSSFAVVGNRLYTQEQRGDEELVVCLDADTGYEVWTHANPTRFWEAMSGPGPRATPTFDSGRILALGANGTLDCLDASTGERIWTRDITRDGKAKVPEWGFASSPLVVDGVVMVFAGGGENQSLLAYDVETGDVRWMSGGGTLSYSSPHPAQLSGVPQVLMFTDKGVQSFAPGSGRMLWEHPWVLNGAARIVQPNVAGNDRVLLGTGLGVGTRSITVRPADDGWQVTENWASKQFKPYFNDFVIHKDHIFGFDGTILACIDLETGAQTWKGGRYGNGQLLLLPDQDLLLVLTEKGELVLVAADPAQLNEIARFPAVQGKTWNHPVICRGKLFVRNDREAACFSLVP